MEMLTPQSFRRLAEMTDAWCISLLMPTHPTGRDIKQDPIRLKNLLEQAETLLTDSGHRPVEVRRRLDPLRELIHDTSFWARRREGLAIYCWPEETYFFAVPLPLSEQIVIGKQAYMVPLIPIISEDVRFFVLALSPKRIRLMEGTRHTALELELPGWPDNFQQLADFIEEEPQIQFHTKAAPYGGDRGSRAAVFHGQAGGDDSTVHKQRLWEYCRFVDERVRKSIGEDVAPLVLACDERLASIYRDASDYRQIVDQTLAGSSDGRGPEELCRAAWQIIEPHINEVHEQAVAAYYNASASGRGTADLDTLLPAAHEGRVATMLVADGAKVYGRYNAEQRKLDLHDRPMTDDEELLNSAMVEAYRQGADLYMLPQEQMPDHRQAVAMLRY